MFLMLAGIVFTAALLMTGGIAVYWYLEAHKARDALLEAKDRVYTFLSNVAPHSLHDDQRVAWSEEWAKYLCNGGPRPPDPPPLPAPRG